MKQKDTLELQIGLKSLESNNKAFEERKFVLRFLDKLSPSLECKARLLISGLDLFNLQTLQFLQQKESNDTSTDTRAHNTSKRDVEEVYRDMKIPESKKEDST